MVLQLLLYHGFLFLGLALEPLFGLRSLFDSLLLQTAFPSAGSYAVRRITDYCIKKRAFLEHAVHAVHAEYFRPVEAILVEVAVHIHGLELVCDVALGVFAADAFTSNHSEVDLGPEAHALEVGRSHQDAASTHEGVQDQFALSHTTLVGHEKR